ncbi:putative Bax inhibitor 1 [Trichinella pseudospiralis]|uniref:Putative Bax inhibitor 1 n=1 Tax=Trichinella pseudospiralis TaxID=6337 RepID=A0A0V1JVX3_TRIPS|nr:putative Bax inhibitor 1 [Trichinella pseudospiralis]KRY90309.1 putative Bax inhibitor 1 [Trichinella pseudospiralis]KRZ39085.1 putative Bax inhibitor 1 [Trichinella pseudospiralis]
MSKTMLNTLSNFYNTLDQKIEKPVQTHLRRVYFSLSASLLAAAAGAYVHLFTDFISGSVWSVLGSLVLLITINATIHTRENELYRFLALMAFSALSGLSTGPLLDFVISVNASLIVTAFMVTAVLFGTLLGMLSAMCWVSMFNMFIRSPALFQVNLYTGLAVMCGFIVYDTQLIMEKKRMGDNDYIRHSVDLFIDFIGIFRRTLIVLCQKEVGAKEKKKLKIKILCNNAAKS